MAYHMIHIGKSNMLFGLTLEFHQWYYLEMNKAFHFIGDTIFGQERRNGEVNSVEKT